MLNASPRCLRLKSQSKIMRETNTAVKRLASKPKVKVTAKPLTGPVPNKNRMAADTIVVTWVSTIVIQACAKPCSTAEEGVFLVCPNNKEALPKRRPKKGAKVEEEK